MTKKMDAFSNVKYPCRNCLYFSACGSNSRTEPCAGRKVGKVLVSGVGRKGLKNSK